MHVRAPGSESGLPLRPFRVDGSTGGLCWHGRFLKPSGDRLAFLRLSATLLGLINSSSWRSSMDIDLPCVYPRCEGGSWWARGHRPRLRLICPCCCALFLSLSLYTNAGTFREKLKHFIACVSCSVDGRTGSLVVVPRDDTVRCSQIRVFQKLIEKGCRLLR